MDRSRLPLTCLLLLVITCCPGTLAVHADADQTTPTRIDKLASRLGLLSLSQLERRLEVIDDQLDRLCPISLRSGVGAVGARSAVGPESKRSEWFQINLDEPVPIENIVLVPTIWRDTKNGLRADGFPLEFRIVVGTASDSGGTVVASYTAEDGLLPRIAPLVVPCPSIVASWVRVEAIRLSPRVWDSQYVFQLSEVLIFSGQENIALNQHVEISSGDGLGGDARHSRFLVDGFVPYLMDAQEGEQSLAFMKSSGFSDKPELSLDLGSTRPLNRIHLHAVDLSTAIPQSENDGYGIPKRLIVEGANRSDFSDAVRLFEFRPETVYDVGPIIMRRFPERSCRYVRLIAIEPDTFKRRNFNRARIGFAEIELFSKGKNVAVGIPVRANFADDVPSRPFSAMTDGRNFYGEILPVKDWLNELARRHDMETERPLVMAELNRRYSRQSSRLNLMTWLAGLAAIGIGVTILIDRIVRIRQLAKLKERFAADLHDELGANLHVIGLLVDLAQTAVGSPEKLNRLHQRIREMAERSGIAVRYCTNILEANEMYQDLYKDMQRATLSIMADIQGELSFQGNEEVLQGLKPRTRADLFLFYKECLVNISRHSEASEFSAQLAATPEKLSLVVSDNGHGMVDPANNAVPPSLQRRARLLGAHVVATHPHQGRTCVTLKMRIRTWGRYR